MPIRYSGTLFPHLIAHLSMKISVLWALLALAAEPAFAGPNTILRCGEGQAAAAVTSWLPHGATSNACHQMVLGAGVDQQLEGRNSEKIAAFKNTLLVGVRPGDVLEAHHHDAPTYQPGEWIESGSTATPGELWWGRTATRHIFVGQETTTRLAAELKQWPIAEQMKASDYVLRGMMAMVQKQPMVSKPGDEKFQVFQRKRMSYAQHGGTMASFDGGSGGDGKIAPGQVSNAKLQLETGATLKGTLSFTLVVDGKPRQFTFPMVSGSGHPNWRLHAATSAGDEFVRCSKRPDRKKAFATDACEILPAANFVERYDATGAFFGDRASLVALQFILTLNSPERNRHHAIATGIIVLKVE